MIRHKTFGCLLTIFLSLIMVIATVFAIDTAEATAPTSEQFATAEQLKTFNTDDTDGSVSAAKIHLGENNRQWWIAGSQSGDSLVLFSASSLGDANFQETFQNQEYEGQEVYANHYGASQIRAKLQELAQSLFNASESALLKTSTIYTEDTLNNKVYALADELYLGYATYEFDKTYFYVGENSENSLESGLRVDGSYWGSENSWLRSPIPDFNIDALTADSCYGVDYGVVRGSYSIRPAVKIDLSKILFGSAAPAAAADGALALADTDGDGAFTLRYASDSLGTAEISLDKTSVNFSGVPEGTYLVVQNSNGAYAKAVSGTASITASDMNVTSFENCKVWLEKTENRITSATLATQLTPPPVTNYDIWVAGEQVTSENAGNILDDGTVSYDARSNTLALNGAVINQAYTSSDYYTSGIYAAGDINITLTGDNSINISDGIIAAGIHANGVIQISGSGSLTLKVNDGSSETRVISTGYTDGEAGVVINSGTVKIDADGERGIYAVYVDGSYGTQLPDRYFRINGGTVEMDAESTSPYSCYATNIKPDFSGYEGYSATAILNSWEVLQAYDENSWNYYRYIKIQPLVYDENGISEDKEHFQPAAPADDGYYEIKNAGNLFWFAEKLAESDDNDALNARLASNITMPEGMNWVAMKVGTYGTPYNGTFDGAEYTISNLSAELEAGVYSNEGLFKTIGENGTVKNLGMINASIKPSSGGAGAICGTNHGLIENCYNLGGEISIASIYGGGIAGENDGIIRRCYNTGSVESTFTYGSSIGGIAGYSHDGGEIIDCYNTGDITGAWYVGGICGELNGGTVKNCYGTGTATATYPGYGSTANPIVGGRLGSCAVENTYYINAAENNAAGKTSAQFASGEVAYLLNANRNEVVWGQTIGTESAPVLGGKAVYAGYEYCYSDSLTYSNDSSKVYQTKPEHNFAKLEYDATSHWYSCTNDGCTAINGKENHKGGQATYFKKAVCEVCNQVYGELSADTIAPTGEISIGTNNWNEFSDSITFDLFFKDAQTVEITAQDDSYDHDGYTQEKRVQIEYYLHTGDTALTKEELDNKTFTAYTGSFNINPGNQYIIYAKITDHAGNVTYLSSDGVVLDAAAPVIAGVTNGATYYTTQSVTVTDENLASVTVNNQVQSASAFTLPGNVEETYTVVATDKAGNVTNYTVTMKPIGSLADSIEGISTDNVTSEDNAAIEAVKAAVEAVNTDEATDEEAEALKSILDSCESLITKLKESVQAGSTGNTEKVEDITADNVKPEDKEDLTAAKEDLENALKNFGGNYTEGEKAALEEKLEQINNALNSIEKAVTVQDAITVLPDTVEPDDTDAEKLINEAKEQYDLLTNHEKSLISEELKEKLENLMGDLLDYRIIEGDGSRWTVGEDGSVTMTANGSVEKFVGIKVDGKEVDAANYTVKSGSTIISLKPEYLNTLSVGKHTLTVIYTDGETSGEFEILKKAESTASGTGDNNNIALWIAILSVSGIVLSVMTYRKKKQSI